MQQRESVYDNLKCFLILLVIVGHLAETYVDSSSFIKSIFIFIYFFHMPAFIFISGLFSKKSIADTKRTREKIFYFLLLYLFCKIFKFILQIIFYQNISFSSLRLYFEDGLPWFMFATAAYYAITWLFRKHNPRFLLVISIILSCIAGYDKQIGDFLCLSRIIVYYPFFLLGYQLNPKRLLQQVKRPLSKVVSITGLSFLFYFSFVKLDFFYSFRPLFTGRNSFFALETPLYGAFYRIIYYFAVTFIIYCLITLTPGKNSFLSKIGQRTLQIYFLHFALIYPIRVFQIAEKIAIAFPCIAWQLLYLCLGPCILLLLSVKIFEYPFTWLEKQCLEN